MKYRTLDLFYLVAVCCVMAWSCRSERKFEKDRADDLRHWKNTMMYLDNAHKYLEQVRRDKPKADETDVFVIESKIESLQSQINELRSQSLFSSRIEIEVPNE